MSERDWSVTRPPAQADWSARADCWEEPVPCLTGLGKVFTCHFTLSLRLVWHHRRRPTRSDLYYSWKEPNDSEFNDRRGGEELYLLALGAVAAAAACHCGHRCLFDSAAGRGIT